MNDPNRGIFESESYAALHRAAGHSTAAAGALAEATNALGATGLCDTLKQVEKCAELHRLFSARLTGVLRQLGEGR